MQTLKRSVKHATLLLLCICYIGGPLQAQVNPGLVQISGTVRNGGDMEVAVNGYPVTLNTRFPVVNGAFNTSLKAVPGIYQFGFGKEYASMYLEDGFAFQLSVNLDEFDESLAFTGKGSTENNFLARFYLDQEAFVNKLYENKELTESVFVNAVQTFYTDELNKLGKLDGVSTAFKDITAHFIKTEKLFVYNNHHYRVLQLTGKEFVPGNHFPDFVTEYDKNNPAYLVVPTYLDALTLCIYKFIPAVRQSMGTGEKYLAFIQIMDSLVSNHELKNTYLRLRSGDIIDDASDKAAVASRMIEIANDDDTRRIIQQHYDRWKPLSEGRPSPGFTFNDTKGTPHTLESFKGKLVYIDIWATWCGPCKVEIPELKKLVNDYKNKPIAFVSICSFDDMEKWRSMVEEKQLTGLQLFNPDKGHPFIKNYMIKSIPRFILIDAQGNIIDANTLRPSDPGLRALLDSHL